MKPLPPLTLILTLAVMLLGVIFLSAPGAARAAEDAEPGEATVEAPDGREVAAGRLIVTYEEPPLVTIDDVRADAAEVDGVPVETYPQIDTAIVEVEGATDGERGDADELEEARATLEAEQGVAAADFDYLVEPALEANDPYFTEQRQQEELRTMRFPQAWDVSTTSTARRTTVAVVDSGCNLSHEDLKGTARAGFDFVNDNGSVEDTMGHGTHVAGSVGAATNNGVGMASGGFGNRVLCEKVFGGPGSTAAISDIMAAMDHASDRGARVINLSLSGGGYVQGFQDLVNRLSEEEEVVVVAAAGNNHGFQQVRYPAGYENVMAVSATDWRATFASFSDFGPYVDVSAVGDDVLSTSRTGGYVFMDGTSMSTPQVSALAGLLHRQGCTTRQEKVSRILQTSRDLGASGKDQKYGFGLIDAGAALSRGC